VVAVIAIPESVLPQMRDERGCRWRTQLL